MRTLTENQAKEIGSKVAQFNTSVFCEMNDQNDPEVQLRIKKMTVWTETNTQVEITLITRNYGVLSFFSGKERIYTSCVYPSPFETVKVIDKYGEVEVDLPVEFLN